jgi:hypothetical protein
MSSLKLILQSVMNKTPKVHLRTTLVSQVEESFLEIEALRDGGFTWEELGSEAGIDGFRLRESYYSVKNKRAGLTTRGKPRKVGPTIFRSPAAKAAMVQSESNSVHSEQNIVQTTDQPSTESMQTLTQPTVKKPIILGAALEKFARHGHERTLDRALADQAKTELNTLLGSKVRP